MWIATVYGFYSVVCPLKDPAQPRQGLDRDRRMIRARKVSHLQNLIEEFPDRLSGVRIMHTGSDYGYRIIVRREEWDEVLLELSSRIEYGNFKDACKKIGRVTSAYLTFLMSVWSSGMRMQTDDRKKVSSYLDDRSVVGVDPGHPGGDEGAVMVMDAESDGDDCQDLFDDEVADDDGEFFDDDYEDDEDFDGSWP